MKADLARLPTNAPIIVYTHRPLFDLKPVWECFTSDGDQVLNALAPYENVTILHGHIHRQISIKAAPPRCTPHAH